MGKKISLSRYIAIGMLLIIVGTVILFVFVRSENRKNTDGKPVTCTITSVFNHNAQGYYTDDDGNKINVEIINAANPTIGDVEEGYILPDKPGRVVLKTPIWLWCVGMGLILLFIAGGIAIIIIGIKHTADFNLLALEGEFAKGTITNIRRDGTGDYVFYIAKIEYFDSDGAAHTFEECYENNRRFNVGDTVNIKYARKKNGKYAQQIL